MPRKMSPEKEREYAELSAYLDFYMTQVEGVAPTNPVHPINVIRSLEAEHGRSLVLRGLQQAVNDTVEASIDMRPEQVAQLDAALRDKGIITLSEMRRRHAAAYRRVLKRGSIKTETEYYLITGILADLSSGMSEEERAQLQQLSDQFEDRAVARAAKPS